MNYKKINDEINKFVNERDWDQFHHLKIFLWLYQLRHQNWLKFISGKKKMNIKK